MAVLYRKYRPQTFSQVLGQKHVVQTLQNQLVAGSVAHAYLFTGGRGVGKTSIARIMAKGVNCRTRIKNAQSGMKEGVGDACGICDVCRQVEAGNFIDLVEIDAASNTGVDNIRELIEHVKFAPSVGVYKVFIIDEVHMLSKGAFNALLKTLEEPPRHTIFILATTEINKVPATIISRTQRFDFVAPSVAEITRHLETITKAENLAVAKEILELVAMHAGGSIRDSLSLLDKVSTLGSNPELAYVGQLLGVTDIALSEHLFAIIALQQAHEIPEFFNTLLESGVDFSMFNKDFLEYLRTALIWKISGTLEQVIPERAEKLQSSSNKLTVADIILITRLFLKSFKDMSTSPNPEIPLLIAGIEAAVRGTNTKSTQGTTVSAVGKTPAVVTPTGANEPAPVTVSQFAFTHVLEQSVAVPQLLEEPVFALALDATVSFDDITPHWPQVIAVVKAMNGPLGNLLKDSPLQKVEDGKIFVGVKFLFHKQNLENQKSLKTICDAVEKVTGKRIGFCASIIKDQPSPAPLDALSDALKMFGGELVE